MRWWTAPRHRPHKVPADRVRRFRAVARGRESLRKGVTVGRAAEPGNRLRMALGASPSSVALRLVFEQGLRLVAAGIAIGTLGAAALTQLDAPIEIRPPDPSSISHHSLGA